MYDIKYFFSIKIIIQSRRGKKNFRKDKLLKILSKNTIFQNIESTPGAFKVAASVLEY
jgi:hypothetical protein